MRLTQKEVDTFISILSLYLSQQEGSLYLYGSRTQDHLKGGDIDLLLVLNSSEQSKKLKLEKSSILNQFKKQIGDRKIDFSILSGEDLAKNIFFSEAMKNSILLKTW